MAGRYRDAGLELDSLFSIKIDGIHEDTENRDFEETFEKYGKIMDIYIPRDWYNNKARGFGFVRFEKEDEALDASDAKDLKILDKEVSLTMATRAKPKGGKDGKGKGKGWGKGYDDWGYGGGKGGYGGRDDRRERDDRGRDDRRGGGRRDDSRRRDRGGRRDDSRGRR